MAGRRRLRRGQKVRGWLRRERLERPEGGLRVRLLSRHIAMTTLMHTATTMVRGTLTGPRRELRADVRPVQRVAVPRKLAQWPA